MTENRFLLDTNAVIALIDGKAIPAETRKSYDEAELYISIITELELFAKKNMTAEEEAITQSFIEECVLNQGITPEIKKYVIALRRGTTIKLPDCIIIATSIALNATLLTCDEKLLKLIWPCYRVQKLS